MITVEVTLKTFEEAVKDCAVIGLPTEEYCARCVLAQAVQQETGLDCEVHTEFAEISGKEYGIDADGHLLIDAFDTHVRDLKVGADVTLAMTLARHDITFPVTVCLTEISF